VIPKGSSGADAELPIDLFDVDGNPVIGHVWATADVKLALPGGVLVDLTAAQVARIVEKGQGRYALQLAAGETGTTGSVLLHLMNGSTWLPHSWQETIIDFGGLATTALLAYAHRAGRTILGFIRRADAVLTNAAAGLKGGTPTYFQPDGVTAEIATTQDRVAGTRGIPDVTGSET
jgi:hypothetical protein